MLRFGKDLGCRGRGALAALLAGAAAGPHAAGGAGGALRRRRAAVCYTCHTLDYLRPRATLTPV